MPANTDRRGSASPQPVQVVCAQVAPVIADLAANRALARQAIREAVDGGAQVIVLPELMTTGYHLDPSEIAELAESPDGASVTAWVEALSGSEAVVIGGFCEAGRDGLIYNSAAMVSAQGVLGVYRKTHLWDLEPRLFTPGAHPPPVIETRWGPIGMAICYDLFFPELTRALALQGAQLLALPTNSPWNGLREEGEAPAPEGVGHAIARSAAYLNRVYVAVCDRHGNERGHGWSARSSVISPEGKFLAGPVRYDRVLLRAECDLADANRKRWDNTINDAFGDRRPQLYDAVTATR